MIRPFYRWKSFWLGLFVLVFLGWAWRESYLNFPAIHHVGSEKAIELSRYRGATRVETGPSANLWLPRSGMKVVSKGFHVGFIPWLRGYRQGVRSFEVRDSLVFFSFLGFWGGWLAWRWRRQRILTKMEPKE